ncbi:MAG: response regulator [candidate division KSB1 bacterium]|nr:response regulator [candidate division KSB1 bacterium]
MKHLLIVEDDSNTLDGMIVLLRDEGFDVHGAMNGAEAIESVSGGSFDMVICDYCLPDIDGLETCLRLKALDANLPIFLVTACYDTRIFRDAALYGIRKVFTKPIEFDDLLQTLANDQLNNN